jgi:hypothetical protein
MIEITNLWYLIFYGGPRMTPLLSKKMISYKIFLFYEFLYVHKKLTYKKNYFIKQTTWNLTKKSLTYLALHSKYHDYITSVDGNWQNGVINLPGNIWNLIEWTVFLRDSSGNAGLNMTILLIGFCPSDIQFHLSGFDRLKVFE